MMRKPSIRWMLLAAVTATTGRGATDAGVEEPLPPVSTRPASSGATGPVRLLHVDPWCDRRADTLVGKLRPAGPLVLSGMRNDWLVTAAVLTSTQPVDVTVRVDGPPGLVGSADLKVVGEVRGAPSEGRETWWFDPLFVRPREVGDLEGEVRNWAAIRDFPRLHLRPGQPVMVWLTVRTHSLAPDEYTGRIVASEATGAEAELPFRVQVWPIELPVDNPIVGYAWQRFGEDRARAQLALDYGINACGYYENWDLCRELRFRYFKFNFPLGQPRGVSLDATDDAILENLKPIQEAVTRLNLKDDEWGIEIFDEPFDDIAWAYAAWMIRIQRLWPEARFWANPGHAPQHNNFSTVKGLVEPLAPYVDTWCPYIAPLPSLLPALRRTGTPVWYYVIEYRHALPTRGGRNIPWLAWRWDLAGWAFYTLETGGDGNPWRDNGCARMYPHNTVSLWLEGLRQGVQDYKRLWRLEQAGLSREELTRIIVGLTPKGEDSPWGGADPPLYHAIRAELDRRLVATTSQPTTQPRPLIPSSASQGHPAIRP